MHNVQRAYLSRRYQCTVMAGMKQYDTSQMVKRLVAATARDYFRYDALAKVVVRH